MDFFSTESYYFKKVTISNVSIENYTNFDLQILKWSFKKLNTIIRTGYFKEFQIVDSYFVKFSSTERKFDTKHTEIISEYHLPQNKRFVEIVEIASVLVHI